MIDYVGRDIAAPRTQTRNKAVDTGAAKVKFVLLNFPVVFTVFFILNLILEHASHHG
ncbi:hypothetical protein [Pantoea sp. CCBC3-3-1]|uniref:hypothetical protein n=1 Tax=Pantoea sp. CCBC3-3-1 TaxID=2490851 RepID=UPI00143CC837|nr:hypothetical protein [Pantoea sp. CCBC3-3-1]